MTIRFTFTSLLLLACLCGMAQAQRIIPQPQSLVAGTGSFALSPTTPLRVQHSSLQPAAQALQQHLRQFYGFGLPASAKSPAAMPAITLQLQARPQAAPNSYTLAVSPKGIAITAPDAAGVFYGVQSLLQWMPLPGAATSRPTYAIDAVTITDAPRFAYRGMMLDVARHFQPVEEVKRLLDRMAMLKLNTFHWHLTEDQGWRIEIKKYPKLTEVGAWRHGTIVGRYPGTANDNQRYGGYYTQEQVKEVVRYAAERYITIVPEIEMPGHSGAAIAAYPFLSCFPHEETIIPKHPSLAAQQQKGKKVMESWGVYEDVFAPTEQTFQFLQDVIDEIVPLFPGKYIHVGGDECPKEAWKRSPFCQQLIAEKGLKDEHGLQSYFIQRMERYINSKGKQIIGWDEILEGGLAPNATVMSWRGEEGGIEAARQQHEVIMTPTSHCYLDYSQSASEDSVTIGGFIPLEKVYAYDPIPAALQGTTHARYVQGVQANVWTEYMRYPAKVQYMIFPRLAALAEVAWTHAAQKSWSRFETAIPGLFARLRMMGTTYSPAYYALRTTISPAAAGGVQWQLETKDPGARLWVTPPGGQPQAYSGPVPIGQSGTWAATLQPADGGPAQVQQQPFALHAAVGQPIAATAAPAPRYGGHGGLAGLLNGATSTRGLNSTEWCGWEGQDAELMIDLGKPTAMRQLVVHSIEQTGSWIYRPAEVVVWTSQNGTDWQEAARQSPDKATGQDDFRTIALPLATTARHLKVLVRHLGQIPSGLPGAGNRAWVFVDEIQVN